MTKHIINGIVIAILSFFSIFNIAIVAFNTDRDIVHQFSDVFIMANSFFG